MLGISRVAAQLAASQEGFIIIISQEMSWWPHLAGGVLQTIHDTAQGLPTGRSPIFHAL
jgi:hypothetical protein